MQKLDTAARKYLKEFLAAMIGYALVLSVSIVLIQHHRHAWWRYPVAVAPILPGLFIVIAVVRQLRRVDELQRRIQLDAMAFAFAGTAVVTFTYGFLEGVGLPRLSSSWVWPVMAVLWVSGAAAAARRYR
jgi:hypothetical protein